MAKKHGPVYIQSGYPVSKQITDADTTADVTIYTGATDGSILYQLIATTDDTSDVVIKVKIDDGTNVNILGTYTLTAAYGTDGTNNGVNLLEKLGVLDPDDPQIPLASTSVVKVSLVSTMTNAKFTYITAIVGEF